MNNTTDILTAYRNITNPLIQISIYFIGLLFFIIIIYSIYSYYLYRSKKNFEKQQNSFQL